MIFNNSDRKSNRRSSGGRGSSKKPRPGSRQDIENRARIKKKLTMVGGALSFAAVAVVVFPMAQEILNQTEANVATNCYDHLPGQESTAVLVDYASSNLYAEKSQMMSMKTGLMQGHKDMKPNNRFEVFTTSKDTAIDYIAPTITTCKQAQTLEQHAELQRLDPNIPDLNKKQIVNASDKSTKAFSDMLDKLIKDSQSSSNAIGEKWNIPLLSQFKSLSRYYKDNPSTLDNLFVFTIGINFDNQYQWCKTMGHLPSYKNAMKMPGYQKHRPFKSFNGTKVTMLMPRALDVYDFGKHCTADEIQSFWKSYWVDAGASEVDIQWLQYRHDAVSTTIDIEKHDTVATTVDVDEIDVVASAIDVEKNSVVLDGLEVAHAYTGSIDGVLLMTLATFLFLYRRKPGLLS